MSATTDSKAELSANNLTSTKQTQKGKNKKRKRIKQTPEEQYQIESADRYNKLHHACSKHLHREAKVVKSFECQKIVRSIKAANDSLGAKAPQDNDSDREKNDTKNSKALKRLETLQQKLDRTKKMELNVLVQVALKRLGVFSLDPRENEEDATDPDAITDADGSDEKAKSASQNSDSKASSQSEDPFYQTLLETILRHKRLSTAMDELNEKVTEYQQWAIFRQAMLRGEGNPEDRHQGGKKKKKHQQGKASSVNDTMVVAGGFNTRKRGLDLGGHEGESGLFIGSLSGVAPEGYADDGENYNGFGEDDQYENQQEKKKNRPGQRARKAKALAIEERKAGRTWDASMNWREKKMDRSEHQHEKGQRSAHNIEGGGHDYKSRGDKKSNGIVKPKDAQQIANMGKTWKEDGNAHPSWAAKATAQKSQGIAKFAGKKITFD